MGLGWRRTGGRDVFNERAVGGGHLVVGGLQRSAAVEAASAPMEVLDVVVSMRVHSRSAPPHDHRNCHQHCYHLRMHERRERPLPEKSDGKTTVMVEALKIAHCCVAQLPVT
jgi:hypothetical protein